MKEERIVDALTRGIENLGGLWRKAEWRGRRDCPDIFFSVPLTHYPTVVGFVECKAPGKKPRPGQDREIALLREAGVPVFVLSTLDEVDEFIGAFASLQ